MRRVFTINCFVVLFLLPFFECFILKRNFSLGSSGNQRLTRSPVSRIYNIDGTITISTSYVNVLKALEEDENLTVENKLSNLGYAEVEIQRSKPKKEELNVQVNLLPDIDSVTLTAVGFALIAFNFFILGNLEDGGVAGIVATIINTLSQ
jgi:hypothetical protein